MSQIASGVSTTSDPSQGIPNVDHQPASFSLGGPKRDTKTHIDPLALVRPSAPLFHLSQIPPQEYLSSLLNQDSQGSTDSRFSNMMDSPDFSPLDEGQLYNKLDTFSLLANVSHSPSKEKELEDLTDEEYWQKTFQQLDLSQIPSRTDQLFVQNAF